MHLETNFEEIIERELLTDCGYHQGNSTNYDPETALFPSEIIDFIKATQPKKWDKLSKTSPKNAEAVLIDSLTKELKSRGMLDVLRNGFKCYGTNFQVAYFQPNTNLNPDTLAQYQQNRLTCTRQVTIKTGRIPDIILSVNGLPIATLELKNAFTGSNAENAIYQYKNDRDPKDPLFVFKERCLVHFAVGTEEVHMTTKLDGKNTNFLPFNKGNKHGAGNPTDGEAYRVSYLWQEVLQRDSILDILARFLHIQPKKIKTQTENGTKYHTRETLIFPRYHQLDVVRKLIAHTKQHKAGHNYLIQHSAGSGKSNSIAWLAHRLSNLHDAQNEKIFHSVIVITDRTILDQQLQDTIYQFDHKAGVIQKIDENTQQLATALSDGVPIIISTIQKFPFITQAIKTLEKKGKKLSINTENKRFAIIVDEAHSSQTGETATELRKILNQDGIEAAIVNQILEDDLDEEDLSPPSKKELRKQQLQRTKQPNLSYFAFTATPKEKTLLVFDEPSETGTSPFHLYTMRQAIEEGYIKDVLANYTCYERYYELIKLSQDDPELPRRKTAQALMRFVELHPHNIGQKVEIIIEHFRSHTRHKIGGRAKAMVVTGSREHAVRYKLAFDKYLKDKGYTDIKCLVAFSGSLSLDDSDKTFTEVSMNGGIKSKEIPEKFESDEYQVLLVANKFQTGFDQPLLHTMFVDKRLAGVQAVQTLSRLNRTATGKEDTFVLDFVNSQEDIYKAFKDYYEVTTVGESADPQQLNDLSSQLYAWQLFSHDDVNQWCEIWFRPKTSLTGGEHQKLNSLLDPIIDKYLNLAELDQEQFKNQLTSFRNLYLFLAQIIPYQDSDLEKLYAYGRFLLKKIPRNAEVPKIDLSGDIDLKFYRLEKVSEGSIILNDGKVPPPLKGATAVGTGSADKYFPLTDLVNSLNERFGTNFTIADQLFFEQITETAIANDSLKQAAKVNSKDNFAPVLQKHLEDLFVERMDGNEKIFTQFMNNEDFQNEVFKKLLTSIYERLNTNE